MTDKCRVSIDELRHDEDEMKRAKYATPVTADELIGNLSDMEPILEGLAYLNKPQQAELLAALSVRDLTEVGRLVMVATSNFLQRGIDNGHYTRESE